MNFRDIIQLADCPCGRSMMPVHCPSCGSGSTYCLTGKPSQVVDQDGTTVEVKTYRCRKCGAAFNDQNRANCTAPPPKARAVKAARMMRQVVDQAMADRVRKGLQVDRIGTIRDILTTYGPPPARATQQLDPGVIRVSDPSDGYASEKGIEARFSKKAEPPVGAGVTAPPVQSVDSSAPFCTNCGTQMVQAGSCHTCPECGNTSGCG